MNFLAHFLLALPTSASLAGNFLGDFITGTPESLRETVSPEVLEGIMMHRRIDVYTDAHASFKAGKALLIPERRRFAGIILDIFTDHFLAKDWSLYSDVPLVEFNEYVYEALKKEWAYFPEDARRAATWMYEKDWFSKYTRVDGIQTVLERMSKRRPRFGAIAGGITEFKVHYEEYETLSHTLLRDALEQDWESP